MIGLVIMATAMYIILANATQALPTTAHLPIVFSTKNLRQPNSFLGRSYIHNVPLPQYREWSNHKPSNSKPLQYKNVDTVSAHRALVKKENGASNRYWSPSESRGHRHMIERRDPTPNPLSDQNSLPPPHSGSSIPVSTAQEPTISKISTPNIPNTSVTLIPRPTSKASEKYYRHRTDKKVAKTSKKLRKNKGK